MQYPEAFLFDLDGVIVDTARFHYLAWKRLANQLGFEFTEQQNEALKGVSRMQSLEIVLEAGGIRLSEGEKRHYAAEKNEYYLALCSKMTPDEVLPGVLDFIFDARQKGIHLGLGSASKNARVVLDRIDMTRYFDTIIDGNKVANSKPDPEVFLLGATELAVNPSRCVVFEDAAAGIEAAKRAGMKAVGIGDPVILQESDLVIAGFEGIDVRGLMDKL